MIKKHLTATEIEEASKIDPIFFLHLIYMKTFIVVLVQVAVLIRTNQSAI